MVASRPPTPVAIRPALEADLDRLVGLVAEVAAEGRWIGFELPFDQAARRERYAAQLDEPSSTVLVAEPDGGPVIGHIAVSVAGYGVADIAMLIAEGWRGQGIGTCLLDAAIGWAAAAGAHKVALEVWPHNDAAIALYLRAGFEVEGRKVRHYRRRNGEIWDSLLMGLQLGG